MLARKPIFVVKNFEVEVWLLTLFCSILIIIPISLAKERSYSLKPRIVSRQYLLTIQVIFGFNPDLFDILAWHICIPDNQYFSISLDIDGIKWCIYGPHSNWNRKFYDWLLCWYVVGQGGIRDNGNFWSSRRVDVQLFGGGWNLSYL